MDQQEKSLTRSGKSSRRPSKHKALGMQHSPPVIVATDCPEDLQCAFCLDSWKAPVEVVPCGHIFCRKCLEGVQMCPVCRESVRSLNKPNRVLVNMALALTVKCMTCGWKGTRERSDSHVCGKSAAAPVSVTGPQGGRHSIIEPTGPTPWTLYGLSQEQYDQIMTLFIFFDSDDSGELDRSEISRLARWLNFAHSERDIDRIFRDMDTSKSGSLSLNEFMTWLSHNRPDSNLLYGLTQSEYHTVMMQFHLYDKNQNGFLDRNEFVRFVLHMNEVNDANSAARLFDTINTSRSGFVDLNEFLSFRLHQKQIAQHNHLRDF